MLKRGLKPNKFLAWTGLMFLKMLGWRVEGEIPPIKKFVMIAAPHTTNWDFPITLALSFALMVKVYWMGKATIFRWPFGEICRWLGGIPVDRSQSQNIVEQSVNTFNESDKLIIIIPPEGSRKKVSYWKTGFYHIARGANVPIVLGFLDYRRKVGGIGPTFYTTGRIEEDMQKIKAFYATVTGKYQAMFRNVQLKS